MLQELRVQNLALIDTLHLDLSVQPTGLIVLTGETDPAEVITRIVSGQPLPDQRFDITTTLCKLRDLFSRH